MQTKLFVRNLQWNTTASHLEELFGTCGTVVSAEIPKDTAGTARGFAIVEMATQVAAEAAIRKLNLHELDGRQLNVRFADTNPKKSGGSKHRR
jgi:nucleolin